MRRLSGLILALAVLLAFLLDGGRISAGLLRPPDAIVVGEPVVSDGDSLRFEGRRTRLLHVDACEMGQPAAQGGRIFDCGAWAQAEVRVLVGEGPVRCEKSGVDQYDRVLAECFLGDGASVNLTALRAGLAFVYDRTQAPRRFIEAEDAAMADRLGVWAAEVEHPRAWRRRAG